MAKNKLTEICDAKKQHIEKQKQIRSAGEIMARAKVIAPRSFHAALQAKVAQGGIGLIAEVKKASPSKGLIRNDFVAGKVAQAYARGGATCISVLTDIPFFQGKDEYIQQIRQLVSVPVLRKDFMLDPYQIIESRALGADAVLLIMAALEDAQATELESAAIEYGLDVLVEVHNEKELERALLLKTRLLGINNRNLKTLKVNLAVTEKLRPLVPEGYTLVSESGIATQEDITRLRSEGVHCFLVGEALMSQPDMEAATRTLLGLSKAE